VAIIFLCLPLHSFHGSVFYVSSDKSFGYLVVYPSVINILEIKKAFEEIKIFHLHIQNTTSTSMNTHRYHNMIISTTKWNIAQYSKRSLLFKNNQHLKLKSSKSCKMSMLPGRAKMLQTSYGTLNRLKQLTKCWSPLYATTFKIDHVTRSGDHR
jgi:hypothetical protein